MRGVQIPVGTAGLLFATLTAHTPSGQAAPERPRAQMECVKFQSPARLPGGTRFRLELPRGLELRIDGTIEVGPMSEPFVDYPWLVSPPLDHRAAAGHR